MKHPGTVPVRVRIFYPSDPLGTVPGGIETFIRGLIGWAPPDIDFSVVGLTTDPLARPVGRWLELTCRDCVFRHYATFALASAGRQPRVPAILRLLFALATRPQVRRPEDFDVAEVHRLEPLPLLPRSVPVTAVMHQDSEVVRQRGADIRWRHLPDLYFALERRLIQRPRTVFSVFESAAQGMRERYPAIADRVRFTPTWLDPDRFHPPAEEDRRAARTRLRARFDLSADARVVLLVGRLESQKHPELALQALAHLRDEDTAAAAAGGQAPAPIALIFVGDGSLRPRLERLAGELRVADRVRFAGLVAPPEIPAFHAGADVFALTSRYEGMPIALLEAMATGLPAVASDVGEVGRVLRDGVNGRLLGSEARTPQAVAAALRQVAGAREHFTVEKCVNSVANYTPEKVLDPIYDNYRSLAAASRRA